MWFRRAGRHMMAIWRPIHSRHTQTPLYTPRICSINGRNKNYILYTYVNKMRANSSKKRTRFTVKPLAEKSCVSYSGMHSRLCTAEVMHQFARISKPTTHQPRWWLHTSHCSDEKCTRNRTRRLTIYSIIRASLWAHIELEMCSGRMHRVNIILYIKVFNIR